MVEHLPCKQEVAGSIPITSSSFENVQGCPSGQWEQTVNLPAQAFEGSNPSPCTSFFAGVAQLVEHQPSKLNVAGSNPVSRSMVAAIAQLVEHVLGKDEVTSSILVGSSKLFVENFCLYCSPLRIEWVMGKKCV
jgi:hypothetical protein